jgi:hypothetical protein
MTSGDLVCAAARAIAAAVRAVPGVVDLTAGPGGAGATYGPGERILGVMIESAADGWSGAARVVVAAGGIRGTAARAQEAAIAAGRAAGIRLQRFDIYVDDVLTEPATL